MNSLLRDPEVLRVDLRDYLPPPAAASDEEIAAARSYTAPPSSSEPSSLADKLAALSNAAKAYHQANADAQSVTRDVLERMKNLPSGRWFSGGMLGGGPDPAVAQRIAAWSVPPA